MPVFLSLGSEERPIRKFEAENISNYTALLLSRDGRTLYVGAREALFALNSTLSFLPGGEYQEVRGCRWMERGGWGAQPADQRVLWAGEEPGATDLHALTPVSPSSSLAAVASRC